MVSFKFKLPAEMLADIKRQARAEGSPASAWIRRAIIERLEREREP